MERCFPKQLAGQYLTYSHVLMQMKRRYQKELRGAKRPAVRKILNRDVSANTPTILCVSKVLRFRSKLPKSGDVHNDNEVKDEIRLELTDGWYALPAVLDDFLEMLVGKGKIQVGSKLMICNAQLLGSDEGLDPLDDCYNSSKRNCPLFLKITANNSRLARWDAKLGFVSPKYTSYTGGSLLIKSLHDIIPGGGTIPVIDLVICKKYPRMFLEQSRESPNQKEVSYHLTEAEEAVRQREYDLRHQRAREKYADEAQRECSYVRI